MDQEMIKTLKLNSKVRFQDWPLMMRQAAMEIGKINFLFLNTNTNAWENCHYIPEKFIEGVAYKLREDYVGPQQIEDIGPSDEEANAQTVSALELADSDHSYASEKDTNPKDSLGVRKVPMHAVSCAVLMEMGLAMMEGGRKYGTHNYRAMGVRASVYYDAALRHIMDWWEGEDLDPDSGLSHITKALSCLSVLRDSMLMRNWEDDRPIRLPDRLNITELNNAASIIVDKYPDCVAPFINLQETVGTQGNIESEQLDALTETGTGPVAPKKTLKKDRRK